nr:MAG TPA: Large Terminase [Caudoviricetes sp.]
MAKRRKSDKEWLSEWKEFGDNIDNATPIDPNESAISKLKRIKEYEANDEVWFRYYFPNFYTSEPAEFHLKSTKKVMNNAEYYLVRSWARELSKSGRTMMEVLKLCLTGKKRNVLLVSNSFDNANRLLMPYMVNLERNNRIINDYGTQKKIGSWESGEFTTRKGVAFRAIGAGQSPRGTRNNEIRPDVILIDDIDTDDDCRNSEIIEQRVKWIEQALIPTRSLSNPLLIIACGNIIADYCCITEMGAKADSWEVVNVRDENGKSTWPQKNTEENIDRVLSTISYESMQKEYYNNPMDGGKAFKNIVDKAPFNLKHCDYVVIYADPATSNSESKKSSSKAVGIIANKGMEYSVHKAWVNQMSNASFVDYLFEAYLICKNAGVEPIYIYIENNTLQNPFYEQVFLPMIYKKSLELNIALPIRPDERKKPEKWARIEGKLEPLVRLERLTFNIKEKDNPHMQRLKAQFKNANAKAKLLDGPDMVEGAITIIDNKRVEQATGAVELIPRKSSPHRI